MKNSELIKLKALAAAVANTEQGSSAWDKETDALNAKFNSHHLVALIEQLEATQRERDEYAESERKTAIKNTTLTDEIYGLKAELKAPGGGDE